MVRYNVPRLDVGFPMGTWYNYCIDTSFATEADERAACVLQKHARLRMRRHKRRQVIRRAWMAREEQKRKAVAPMITKDIQKRMCTLIVMHTKRFVCVMNPFVHKVQHLYEDIAKITKMSNFTLRLAGKRLHTRQHKKLYHVGAAAGHIYTVTISTSA